MDTFTPDFRGAAAGLPVQTAPTLRIRHMQVTPTDNKTIIVVPNPDLSSAVRGITLTADRDKKTASVDVLGDDWQTLVSFIRRRLSTQVTALRLIPVSRQILAPNIAQAIETLMPSVASNGPVAANVLFTSQNLGTIFRETAAEGLSASTRNGLHDLAKNRIFSDDPTVNEAIVDFMLEKLFEQPEIEAGAQPGTPGQHTAFPVLL